VHKVGNKIRLIIVCKLIREMKTRSHLLLAVITSASVTFSYGSLTTHFF